MSVHPVFRLHDVSDVVAGDPAPQDPKAFASDGPLFVRMQDVGRHHLNPALSGSTDRLDSEWLAKNRLRLFPKDSILIPKSGASVNLNHRAKLATDAYVVSHLAVVIPNRAKVDPDYLFWWSARYDPRAQVQVTSLPSLKLSTLKEAVIPLPTLDEQRQIVGILNRAARIERLRARAADRLREFIPALFIKMFGDPIENPMGWSSCKMGNLGTLDRGRSKHRPRNAPHLYEGSYPFIQTGDIATSNGSITEYTQTYSEAGLDQSRIWPAGTLCITIAANIGMTGVLAFDACFPDSVVGFIPNNRVTVEYIQTGLDLMQNRIEERAPQSTQRNINLKFLRELEFPVAPLRSQSRFSECITKMRDMVATSESTSKTASALNISLMTRLLGDSP